MNLFHGLSRVFNEIIGNGDTSKRKFMLAYSPENVRHDLRKALIDMTIDSVHGLSAGDDVCAITAGKGWYREHDNSLDRWAHFPFYHNPGIFGRIAFFVRVPMKSACIDMEDLFVVLAQADGLPIRAISHQGQTKIVLWWIGSLRKPPLEDQICEEGRDILREGGLSS